MRENFRDFIQPENNIRTYKSLTVMFPYATMDEDICNIAKDKHVSLALLPFHRQQTADGQMEEEGNSAAQEEKASCSIAVFVD